MPAPSFIVLLAVTALVVVAAALCREVLALRGERRDVDRYLRWLLTHATGPLSLARLQAKFTDAGTAERPVLVRSFITGDEWRGL